MTLFLRALADWLTSIAHAQSPMDILGKAKCGSLPGCGAGPFDVLFKSTIPTVAEFAFRAAAGLSLVFVIYGGYQYLTSMGDESKDTKARMTIVYSLMGLGIAITSGSIVGIVTGQNFGQGSSGDPIFGSGGFLNAVVAIAVIMFNVIFAIMIVYAGMRMVAANGKADEFGKANKIIVYAIVGAIIVNASKAIVQAFLAFGL